MEGVIGRWARGGTGPRRPRESSASPRSLFWVSRGKYCKVFNLELENEDGGRDKEQPAHFWRSPVSWRLFFGSSVGQREDPAASGTSGTEASLGHYRQLAVFKLVPCAKHSLVYLPFALCFIYFLKFTFKLQLTYNIILGSGIQQSDWTLTYLMKYSPQ